MYTVNYSIGDLCTVPRIQFKCVVTFSWRMMHIFKVAFTVNMFLFIVTRCSVFLQVQHGINKGKCGVCGDRYDVKPRANEPGGKYANGIISNTYTTNDTSILVVVDIQSYLGGYFEFRICPNNSPQLAVTENCLNRHQLRVWDVFNKEPRYRYFPQGIGLQRLRVEIPQGMTCSQCVLQWKWRTGK